jgi:hypothetical protein
VESKQPGKMADSTWLGTLYGAGEAGASSQRTLGLEGHFHLCAVLTDRESDQGRGKTMDRG